MGKKKVTTKNTPEDIDLMVRWFEGVCILNRRGQEALWSERNLAIKEEIIRCIKSTQE